MDDKQYLENIGTFIENSMINKVNEYQQFLMKNDKFNDPYELTNLIIHRHLVIKTFEEINKESKEYNRQFRADFDKDAYKYLDEPNYSYFNNEGCMADDGELLYFKMREEMYALDHAKKKHTNDKELKIMPKRIKSKVAKCRIEFS